MSVRHRPRVASPSRVGARMRHDACMRLAHGYIVIPTVGWQHPCHSAMVLFQLVTELVLVAGAEQVGRQ